MNDTQRTLELCIPSYGDACRRVVTCVGACSISCCTAAPSLLLRLDRALITFTALLPCCPPTPLCHIAQMMDAQLR